MPAPGNPKIGDRSLVALFPGLRHTILLATAAAAVGYGYVRSIDIPFHPPRAHMHRMIVSGSAPSPYRYRILVPYTVEGVRRTLPPVVSSRHRTLLAYGAYDIAAILFSLVAIFAWLRVWFAPGDAMIGALFTCSILPVPLQDHFFQPWSLLEPGLFAMGLVLQARQRHLLLLLVVVLAALNRETAVFLPVALLLAHDWRGSRMREGARLLAYAACCVAVLLLLRLALGSAPPAETAQSALAINLERHSLVKTAVAWSLFLGAAWVPALLGLRHAPPTFRRLALLVPLYLIPVAIWGIWFEVRLLMTLYCVLIPPALFYLRSDRVDVSESPRA